MINADLTWEPQRLRWRKKYKGKVYVISCQALGVEENKVGSYKAANEWWRAKKIEIDSGAPATSTPARKHPHAAVIAQLDERLEWARSHGDAEAQRTARESIREVQDLAEGDESLAEWTLGGDQGRAVWHDRLKRHESTSTPKDRTVGAQVARFLDLEKVRVKSEAVSVGEYEIVSRALHDFRDWIGAEVDIKVIDADRVEGYWSHLLGADLAVETKKKKLRHARNFIGWMSEKGLIPRPANLDSRKHRFGGGLKAIKTIDPKEAKRLIGLAPGQLKLHLMLFLNCGMTQVDITDLKPSEVDWEKGRIKRKRSKTSDHEHVPIVDYPLWPATFELLKRYGHRTGDHALLTASGQLWVRDKLKADGKRSKVDNIKSNFAHVKKRHKLDYSMKSLRKTSASMLETQPEFARYATMFLGHSPRTIADRHYVRPDQDQFDKAVEWLGGKFGMA